MEKQKIKHQLSNDRQKLMLGGEKEAKQKESGKQKTKNKMTEERSNVAVVTINIKNKTCLFKARDFHTRLKKPTLFCFKSYTMTYTYTHPNSKQKNGKSSNQIKLAW